MKRGVRSLEDVDEDSFMKNTMHTHTITTSYYSLLTTRHIEKTIIETIDYYYYYYYYDDIYIFTSLSFYIILFFTL